MRNAFIALVCGLVSSVATAQVSNTGFIDTTGGARLGKISLNAYIDAYYGYYSAKPVGGDIPYLVSMNRNNEFNINLSYIEFRYSDTRLRGRIVPGFGSYMSANYASEKSIMKNIVEASVGVKLFEKKDIWIDCGVLGSPFTNENPTSKDHLMYTRSLSAENSPYYLTGVKATIPLSKKVSTYAYLVNGWQQISDVNQGKSFVGQVEYRPGKKHLFDLNLYVGDERADARPLYRTRYFVDGYWIFSPEGKVSVTSCASFGLQSVLDTTSGGKDLRSWAQANFILRYRFSPKTSLSGRVEYFIDPNNMLVKTVNGASYNTLSTGLCLNVLLFEKAMYRVEARYLYSPEDIYKNAQGSATGSNYWLINSLAIWF